MVEIGKMQNVPPRAQALVEHEGGFLSFFDGLPIRGMKKEISMLQQFGILDTNADIDRWVTLSYMKAAAANYRR
jgi:hypothetical protein